MYTIDIFPLSNVMQQQKKRNGISSGGVILRSMVDSARDVAGLFQNILIMVLGVININERQIAYILEALLEKKSREVVPQNEFVFDFTKSLHQISL